MSESPHAITDDDIQALRAHREKHADAGNPALVEKITPQRCRRIRAEYDRPHAKQDLADEFGVSPSRVQKHARGKCRHGSGGE